MVQLVGEGVPHRDPLPFEQGHECGHCEGATDVNDTVSVQSIQCCLKESFKNSELSHDNFWGFAVVCLSIDFSLLKWQSCGAHTMKTVVNM